MYILTRVCITSQTLRSEFTDSWHVFREIKSASPRCRYQDSVKEENQVNLRQRRDMVGSGLLHGVSTKALSNLDPFRPTLENINIAGLLYQQLSLLGPELLIVNFYEGYLYFNSEDFM